MHTGDRWKLLALTSLALWIVVGAVWLIGSDLFSRTRTAGCTRETLRTIQNGDDLNATIFTTTCHSASLGGAPVTTSVAITKRPEGGSNKPTPTNADTVFTVRDVVPNLDVSWPRPQSRDQIAIDYPSHADIVLAIIKTNGLIITYRPR